MGSRNGCSAFSVVLIIILSVVAFHLYFPNGLPTGGTDKNGSILPQPAPQLAPGAVPPTTQSIYMYTIDPQTMHDLGCQEAKNFPYGLIILDWGAPYEFDGRNYGQVTWADQFGRHQAASDTQIGTIVESFIQGIWDCRTNATDFAVGIGLSNNGPCWGCPHPDDSDETKSDWYQSGKAWGTMVNAVEKFIIDHQMSGQIVADGADDIEIDDGWEWGKYPVAETRAFVDGYNAATKQLFFDFGDDSGGSNLFQGEYDGVHWRAEDVWYVAYGAPDDLPLPEVYAPAQAFGWEQLSQWACGDQQAKNAPMRFVATMDEWPGKPNAEQYVSGEDPSWTTMRNDIASDSCTQPMASSLLFSTNINFWSELCSPIWPSWPVNGKKTISPFCILPPGPTEP
jgi:hypothetical protein